MTAIVFLIGFLVLSLVGALILWLRDRGPRSMEAHMKAFERELHALSPDAPIEQPRRRRADQASRPGPASPPRPRPGNPPAG